MKALKINIFIFTALTVIVAACGPSDSPKGSLEELKEKRDKIKAELEEINTKIDSLESKNKETIYQKVRFTSLEVDTFIHKIEVQGDVEAEQNISLNAESNGIIRKLNVSDGDEVKKGQTLAVIDAELINDNIREVEASLELAEFVYEKQKKLYDEGVTSELQFKEAKNNKVSLEKRLASLRTQRNKTVVKAPFSGHIDEVFVKQGEMISPQMPMLRLVNNDEVKISAEISEQHLTSVGVGVPVEFQFPVLKDTIIKSQISIKGNYINPTNRTFKVQSVIKDNELLLPNMVAIVRVTDVKVPNAKIIPINSVLQDNKDNWYVYRLKAIGKDDEGEQLYKAEKVIVTIKGSFNNHMWVESDAITVSDKIVTDGAKGIVDGEEVKVDLDK